MNNKTPVNVKVVVRCRPNSDCDESSVNYQIDIKENSREIVVQNKGRRPQSESNTKSYTFDGVCGPNTSQEELFNHHIVPLVEEVLQGFNCTIFAYGQTGTGKTYTMEGDWTKTLGSEPNTPVLQPITSKADQRESLTPNYSYHTVKLPKGVGMIPRSIDLIFNRLNELNCESGLRVSFLEIYNEELNDLLQPPGSEKQSLRIFEQSQNLTKGLAVKGLTEVPVSTLPEVYSVLSNATKKRKTAETLLNRQSSRSHSIFTIAVTIKEISPEGDDVIRIGKLNLVDLAGSENIQRSGSSSSQIRTKEACIINQSLVALGRVINALVSGNSNTVGSGGSNYIPYRDSKLTRLLQDSLGGHTKTCIIATISTAGSAVEETISTLDYAYRAKHIKNIPTVNQRMSQKFLIKELTMEIEKLRKELLIARERSGEVHLAHEDYVLIEHDLYNYEEMKKSYARLELEARQMIDEIDQLKDLVSQYEELKRVYRSLKDDFTELSRRLMDAETRHKIERQITEVLSRISTTYFTKIEGIFGEYIPILEQSFSNYNEIFTSVAQEHNKIIKDISAKQDVNDKTKLTLSEYILVNYCDQINEHRTNINIALSELLDCISNVDDSALQTRVSDILTVCEHTLNDKFTTLESTMKQIFASWSAKSRKLSDTILKCLNDQNNKFNSVAEVIHSTGTDLVQSSLDISELFNGYVAKLTHAIYPTQITSQAVTMNQIIETNTPAVDARSTLLRRIGNYIELEVKSTLTGIIDNTLRELVQAVESESTSYAKNCLTPNVERVAMITRNNTRALKEMSTNSTAVTEELNSSIERDQSWREAAHQSINELQGYYSQTSETLNSAITSVRDELVENRNSIQMKKDNIGRYVREKMSQKIENAIPEQQVKTSLQQMQTERQELSESLLASLARMTKDMGFYILNSRMSLIQRFTELKKPDELPELIPKGFNSLDDIRLGIANNQTDFGDTFWNSIIRRLSTKRSSGCFIAPEQNLNKDPVDGGISNSGDQKMDEMMDENGCLEGSRAI